MKVAYTFRELLAPLEGTRAAVKLAVLSGQIKIEQPLLSEIMFNGNLQFRNLDFYLEEKRRDLTIRTRPSDRTTEAGVLIDWVEAKMCYTDCLARLLTGGARRLEYRDLLCRDAEKQMRGIKLLPLRDRGARLTSLLFAVHRDTPVWRQKFHPRFKNRGQHEPAEIEEEARRHVHKEIAPYIERAVVEDFSIRLDKGCWLHVFALRSNDRIATDLCRLPSSD